MTQVLQNLWELTSTENLRSKLYILQNLTFTEKNQLLKELYSVSEKIFINYTFKDHQKLLDPENAIRTYVSVCSNADNEKLGYFTIQVFKTKINNRNAIIFRNQTGIVKNYRRKIGNIYLLVLIFIYYRFRYPFTPMLSCLVILNPKVYLKLSKLMYDYLPRPQYIETKRTKAIITDLVQYFNFKIQSSDYQWSINTGNSTKFEADEIYFLKRSEEENLKYYFDQNPDMSEGFALLSIIPYSWANIILSSFKVLSYLIKRMKYQQTN